jgi:hypothetical protein
MLMDTSNIPAVANIAVSLLIPYLKKVAEGIAQKSGEKIGKAAGEIALDKAKQLYNTVRESFDSKPDAKKALEDLEKSLTDRTCQTDVEHQLVEIMSLNNDITNKIISLIEEADSAGADTIFHTKIRGKVKKLVQIGVVRGDVII